MHTSYPTARGQGAFDVESLLRPLDGTDPAGRDLTDADEYQAIREHRRADVDIVLRDDPFDRSRRLFRKPDQKSSDWQAVARLGCEALRTKTKDLQIAAWVAEALGQLHGFERPAGWLSAAASGFKSSSGRIFIRGSSPTTPSRATGHTTFSIARRSCRS